METLEFELELKMCTKRPQPGYGITSNNQKWS